MKFNRRHLTTLAILLSLFALFIGCGGGGSSSSGSSAGTGTLSVSLTDSTTDLYRAVYVTINEVQVCRNDNINPSVNNSSNDVVSEDDSSENGCNWKTLDPPDGIQFPKTYNLLKLVNGVTEAIGSGEFSAGRYNQVRLIIGDSPELENNLLGEPHPSANYVILNNGSDTIETLKIPSGFQTGIKLVHPFQVADGEIKELVLDFDADRSVVKAGNSGKYILKPTIKIIENEDKIDVGGTVTVTDDAAPPAPLPGVQVSAQISDGLSATVVRSTISSDGKNAEDVLAEGEYLLTLLSPDQLYNIVAYSEGKSPACVAFRYNDQNPPLPLNFQLSPADTATVVGKVRVDPENQISEDFPLIVTGYTELGCNHPDGEGYVELTKANTIKYLGSGVFEYEIVLPRNSASITYDIVASADGYIPDTTAITLDSDALSPVPTPDQLIISPSGTQQ